MEPYKLAKLALKLGSKQKNKKPKHFYTYIVFDKLISDFFSNLSGEEITILCFMSSAVSMGSKPDELYQLYQNLKTNIFTFSIGEVIDDEPLEECDQCNGTGEVSCEYCDGTGRITCDDCDGEGVVENDEGELETCYACGGDGDFDCNRCRSGFVDCDNCHGYGEVAGQHHVSVDIREFVSYDSDIFHKLEIMEEETELDNYFLNEVFDSELTFEYNYKSIITDILPTGTQKDDLYFLRLESHPVINRNYRGELKSNVGNF